MNKHTRKRPLVSVIVPAFNASLTLREAVASVLEQTYRTLECLVIDDGSSDGTVEIAKKLIAEDGRVRLLQHPDGANLGTAVSRNLGLKNASGKFIAFLDSDDAWLPSKLERQLKVMNQRPDVGFVFGDVFVCVDPDPARPMSCQPLSRNPFRESMAQIFNAGDTAAARVMNLHLAPSEYIPSPTPLVRRSVFEGGLEFTGPPQLNIQYEDFLMWRVLSMKTRFACIQEPLAIYRVHGDSFTGRFKARRNVVDHLVGIEEVERLFIESCKDLIDDEWRDALRENQKTRLIGGAHRAPWRELPRFLKLARKYGVATEVLRRRIRKAAITLRSNLFQLKLLMRGGISRSN